jgi:hypothetical protein
VIIGGYWGELAGLLGTFEPRTEILLAERVDIRFEIR